MNSAKKNTLFSKIKKGFTLVELVIVIAVIAVLSAILIPTFGNVIKDSRVSSLKANLNVCTQNLIMYATYNHVDYYTPAVVREFLESHGIVGTRSDSAEWLEDGYSLWYNQQNFNLQLIKNDELGNYIAGGRPVNTNSNVAYADGVDVGAGSVIDNLPRRPEAITANKNMLLMATDAANSRALKGIELIYTGADTNVTYQNCSNLISDVGYEIESCGIFNYANGWSARSYLDEFSPSNTAWLNNAGEIITDATPTVVDTKSIINIKNIIVSPNIGQAVPDSDITKLSGTLKTFAGTDHTNSQISLSTTVEIATTYDVEITESFYNKFGNLGVDVVVSGANVSVESGVSSNHTMTVSTVTGGGKNISAVVSAGGGSAVIGGGGSSNRYKPVMMSSTQFGEYITNSIVTCQNISTTEEGATVIRYRSANGKVETVEAGGNWLEREDGVVYKYTQPEFSVDVSAFLKKEFGITTDLTDEQKKQYNDAVSSIHIRERTYNGVTSTSMFMLYEKDGVTYGKTFNFGVGYINSFDHYYRYPNFEGYLGYSENLTKKLFEIDSTDSNAKNAGSLVVKLPDGANDLQSYSNIKVRVYYKDSTEYYKKETSTIGGIYYESTGIRSGNELKTIDLEKDSKGYYTVDFGTHDIIGLTPDGADHFVNSVAIERIEVVDLSGGQERVLIAKYPQ